MLNVKSVSKEIPLTSVRCVLYLLLIPDLKQMNFHPLSHTWLIGRGTDMHRPLTSKCVLFFRSHSEQSLEVRGDPGWPLTAQLASCVLQWPLALVFVKQTFFV